MFNFILPRLILNVERWKYNKDYDVYVSTLGHFKDSKKRLLPVKVGQKGYLQVHTSRGSKSAHRLVMLTWRPIPDAENLTVDHLNHNKRDNSVTNLEWVTRDENQRRAKNDLDVDNMIKDAVSMQAKIFCIEENKFFNNSEVAAIWLIKNKKELRNTTPPVKPNTVAKKIRKACFSGELYHNYHWKEVIQICRTREHIFV